MKPPRGSTLNRQAVDAQSVEAWLRDHPDFLAQRPDLYLELEPPQRVHGERMADHMAAMLAAARVHVREVDADMQAALSTGRAGLGQDAGADHQRRPPAGSTCFREARPRRARMSPACPRARSTNCCRRGAMRWCGPRPCMRSCCIARPRRSSAAMRSRACPHRAASRCFWRLVRATLMPCPARVLRAWPSWAAPWGPRWRGEPRCAGFPGLDA
ncbi:MAG: DUF484 family protein [Alphaproteobacteria bacterium]|nr:DUF484 family protein [Alphaproteobacteria bacterium]